MVRFFFFFLLLVEMSWSDALLSVLEKGRLRVCVWPEYYGISYLDPRTQTLVGIDVDLARELGRDLGVQVAFVPSSFATFIEDIEQAQCDIAMFAIGHTASRKERLLLTSPHLVSDVYAVATKGNRRIRTWEDIDQDGVVVAVAKGTYHVEVMRQALQKARLLVVDSLHAREQEVAAGRADVFMTDYPFGVRMVAQRDWARLIVPPTPFFLTPYGWAVNKGEEALLARVEAFLEAIKKDGRLKEAAARHQLLPIVQTLEP